MPAERRIAVTGIGVICAIGRNQGEVWESILASRGGVTEMTRFSGEVFPTNLAAEVPEDLEPLLSAVVTERSLSPAAAHSEMRRMSRSDLLGIIAVAEAIAQANAAAKTPLSLERAIVSSGTSTGGLLEGESFFFKRRKRGARRTPASTVLQQPTNGPSDAIARFFAAGGGVFSNATACASGGAAIGMAADLIRSGHAAVAIAGGTDALCRLTYSGFNVLQAVDGDPCTPFDQRRKGINLGEGAGYLILEPWEDAIARGAAPLAEFLGYGASCDAHHPTAPIEDGSGARDAMQAAIVDGRSRADAVQYINAHGTGTLLNDAAETEGIRSLVSTRVPVSSTKSFFGHTLGAAGGVEAVVTVLALTQQTAPPTLRLEQPVAAGFDYVPHASRPMQIEQALSNTFGFGGSNVSLLFARAEAK